MDTLTVATTEGDDGSFVTRWKYRQHGEKQPDAGVIITRLDESYNLDRPIIAELGAIQHLLDVRKIHGPGRLGAGLRIEVSFGAIRKALLKGALKRGDYGDTEKKHVAGCASFLATKYFEAVIEVCHRWREEEHKPLGSEEIHVPQSFPGSRVYCHLLGEDVIITRHAMRRQIVRIDTKNPAKPKPLSDNDLSNIPDKWWGTAWRWFEKIFREGSTLRYARLQPKWHAYYTKKYGPGSLYLWHPDSRGIVIVKRDRGAYVSTTVLHDKYSVIEREPVQVGQRLVSYQTYLAMSSSA